MINDYSTGRTMQPGERLLFSGAARDPQVGADLRRLRDPADRRDPADGDRDAAGAGRQRALCAGTAARARRRGAAGRRRDGYGRRGRRGAPAPGATPDGDRGGKRDGAQAAASAAGVSSRLIEAGPEEAATAVAFLHGNPGSSDDWEPLIAAVGATGKRALAFDLPDFGETIAAPGFEHTVPGYAAFVDAALAALGVERVYLVLHDFGGPIGLHWIAGHADQLAGLTLIDIGILPGYKWHRLARLWRTPWLGELFQATATRPAFRFLVNRDEPRGLPRPFLEGMYDHYDRRTKRAVLKLYRATDEPGSPDPELLAALRERGELPALVIWARAMPTYRRATPSVSACLFPDKGQEFGVRILSPDLSVGMLEFDGGVVARLSNSILAPANRSLRVIGLDGVATVTDVWEYHAPVRISLTGGSFRPRLIRAFEKRLSRYIPGLLIGRSAKAVTGPKVGRTAGGHRMDFARGISQLAAQIEHGAPARVGPDLALHVTEVTLALQGQSANGRPVTMQTGLT